MASAYETVAARNIAEAGAGQGVDIDGVVCKDDGVVGNGVQRWFKLTIGYAEVTDVDQTETFDLGTLKSVAFAGDVLIDEIFYRVDTLFVGTGVTTLALDVGEDQTPDTDGLIVRKELVGGTPAVGDFVGLADGDHGATRFGSGGFVLKSGQEITVTFTVTGGAGNLDDLTAGQITLWIVYIDL